MLYMIIVALSKPSMIIGGFVAVVALVFWMRHKGLHIDDEYSDHPRPFNSGH